MNKEPENVKQIYVLMKEKSAKKNRSCIQKENYVETIHKKTNEREREKYRICVL